MNNKKIELLCYLKLDGIESKRKPVVALTILSFLLFLVIYLNTNIFEIFIIGYFISQDILKKKILLYLKIFVY